MILLRLISWPYVRRHLARVSLTTLGIVLGVAVFVAMYTANQAVLEAVPELHEFEQLARAVGRLAPRPPAQMQRQRHVLDTGERRQQVEELEDEADLVTAHAGQAVVREL